MARLRGVIFGIRNVLLQDLGDGKGRIDGHSFEETGKLVKYLHANHIQPIVLANHDWSVSDGAGKRHPLKDVLESEWKG